MKADRIDAQWQERSPGWSPDEHRNERELLSLILRDGENIEALLAGSYKAEFLGASEYSGIVMATGSRVVFVYNGIFGRNVADMPYESIQSVEFSGETFDPWKIIGRGTNGYQINNAKESEAGPFFDCVREHLNATDLP